MTTIQSPDCFFPHLSFMGNIIRRHQVKSYTASPVLIVMALVAVILYDCPLLILASRPDRKSCQNGSACQSCPDKSFQINPVKIFQSTPALNVAYLLI